MALVSTESAPSGSVRHCLRPVAMMAKPARSRAWFTAASWVTMSCAVAALLDHAQDAADLALGPAQPVDHGAHLFGFSSTIVAPWGRCREWWSGCGVGGL